MNTQTHTTVATALVIGCMAIATLAAKAPGGSDSVAGDESVASVRFTAAGPVVALETDKGVIEIQTFPEDAPKTVANFVALVKKNFYRGQRFHRVEKGLLIQIGDPQSRSMLNIDYWGRGNSGTPIGVAEISKTRRNVRGAVALAHTGSAADATSQFYILLRDSPSLNGKFAVFGQVINGLDVAAKIERADRLKNASMRE
jgi:peptidyl-prolyl cis-trans isomerase B (cyclophilin B)